MPTTAELKSLGTEGLAELLRRHGLLIRVAAPQNLDHVAALLSGPVGALVTSRLLSTPDLQVVEAVVDLGGTVDADDVRNRLGLAETGRPAVQAALSRLVEKGLVRAAGGGVQADPVLAQLLHDPYGLGEPFAAYADELRVANLKAILATWGLPTVGRKDELLQRVCDALDDPDAVRDRFERLSPEARELVVDVVAGDHVTLPWSSYYRQLPHQQAIDSGLLLVVASELVAPREVVTALAAADWKPPFQPDPPPLTWVAVDPQLVERQAEAAASEAVRLVTQVVESCGRRPVRRRKDGVFGSREVKRLAKEAKADELDVVQALDLALIGTLLVSADDDPSELRPGPAFEEWLRQPPGGRAMALARLWWVAPQVVRTADGVCPLPCRDCAPFVVALRKAALGLLREGSLELAAPAAPAMPEQVAAVIAWRMPLAVDHLAGGERPPLEVDPLAPNPATGNRIGIAGVVEATASATLAEAAWLGLVSAGALSAAGSALLRDDRTALESALGSLGELKATARVQADLTAVVMGVPEPGLTRTLDLLADREASGAATSWRFSPSSVRRGFDAGLGQDEILSRLRQLADGPLPQALEYLVVDVARRHGQVRVGEASCYLVAQDPAIAAEIAADRTLRHLGLTVVGDVVLVGTRSRDETLAALRKAGYAPMPVVAASESATAATGATGAREATGAQLATVTPIRRPPAGHPDPRGSAPVAADDASLLDERVDLLQSVHGSDLNERDALDLAEQLLAAPASPWSPFGPGPFDGFDGFDLDEDL